MVATQRGRLVVVNDPAPGDTTEAAADGNDAGTLEIVVVGDRDDVRFVVCETLRRRGWAVDESNGADAVGALTSRATPPDVVLLERRLTPRSGPELVQLVHARWPGVPCVLMCGFDVGGDDRLDAVGVQAVLHQPIGADLLTATVVSAAAHRPV